eukprot:TRINITY_DN20769_c0_g1_i1.p1 TRINITY_DN20769_c0_g1~~TRINITY_DN20769_c0_g1_i1.p1  ORF type:complete len:1082 (-),score=135.68 TRINITY_DN20769_c0_g1_i1:53-3298(-)
MIRRPPRSTLSSSSAASDVYKRQVSTQSTGPRLSAMGLLLLLCVLALGVRAGPESTRGTPIHGECRDQANDCGSGGEWCFSDGYFERLKSEECLLTCGFCAPPLTDPAYISQRNTLLLLQRQSTCNDRWKYWQSPNISFCAYEKVYCGRPNVISELVFTEACLEGTIPPELVSITSLVALSLNSNHLSGTIPSALVSLSNLTSFVVSRTLLSGTLPSRPWEHLADYDIADCPRISGTLPSSLGRHTSLASLSVANVGISGSIPSHIFGLASLRNLAAQAKRLSGTLPAEMCSLTRLAYLVVGPTRISGIVPKEIACLTHLASFLMNDAEISGTLPSELSKLTSLYHFKGQRNELSGTVPAIWSLTLLWHFQAFRNHLSGTIPHGFSSLTSVFNLNLHANSLSGSIPAQLSLMTPLISIDLRSNSLSGTIPSGLYGSSLPRLHRLLLKGNSFSGTVPSEVGREGSELTLLSIESNRLSGEIPSQIARLASLSQLLLQSNRLSGTLPPLSTMSGLRHLVIFDNSLGGHIEISEEAQLDTLLVHNNRLSCSVTANFTDSAGNISRSLALPGNAIQAPVPVWWAMSSVGFLRAHANLWQEWRVQLVEIAVGVVMLLVVIGATARSRVCDYFSFTPEDLVERLQVRVSLLVALWAAPVIAVLVPVYIAGAEFYECGKYSLYGTIAYLDRYACEWAAAVAAVGFAMLSAGVVETVRCDSVLCVPLSKSRPSHTSSQRVLLYVVWTAVLCVLSIPSALYALSTSVPGDHNALGIGSGLLTAVQRLTGSVLSLITAFVIPETAKKIAKMANNGVSDRQTALKLMMAGRFVVALVVPALMIIILDQSCMAQWLRLWTGCEDSSSFDLSLTLPSGLDGEDTAQIVRHNDICEPAYNAARCPRAVVGTLGTLISQKLVFAAFVIPPMMLVWKSHPGSRAREWTAQHVFQISDFSAAMAVDREFAGIVMLMEYPLVLGLCVPQVVPLAALAIAQGAASFHFAREHFEAELTEELRPSSLYLWCSGMFGYSLVTWFFFCCQLQGAYLVAVGMPLAACGTVFVMRHLRRRSDDARMVCAADLKTSLLQNEDTLVL